jgi:hypothetical protein
MVIVSKRRFGMGLFMRLSILAAFGLMFAACGKINDMHDATNDLRDTSRDLKNTSSQIVDTSNHMHSNLIKKDGLDVRIEATRKMRGDLRISDKIADAVAYFRAFQYQFWSAATPGGLAKRNQFALDAVREFFREVQEFLPYRLEVPPNPLAQAADDEASNREASLNAFAAGLSQMDDNENDALANDPTLPKLTMMTMIETGLKAGVEIRAGRRTVADYPVWIGPIREFESIAIYLLQARHNIAAAIALGEISNLEADGTAAVINMFCHPWTPNFLGLLPDEHVLTEPTPLVNDEALRKSTEYFVEGGHDTREILKAVGVAPKIDPILKGILSHLQAPPYARGLVGPGMPAQPGYIGLVQQLIGQVNETAAVPDVAATPNLWKAPIADSKKRLIGGACHLPKWAVDSPFLSLLGQTLSGFISPPPRTY